MVDIASLGFSIDTSDVSRAEAALDGLNNAGAKTEAAAKGVGTAWSGAAKKASGSAGEFQRGTDAIRQQQDALTNLLGRIDPVIKKLGDLDAMEKELRNFKLAGVIELESFNEYQNKIDFSRRSLTAFDDILFRTGNTSKQTAQAMRQLPAQFSDIFISLQAGQSPLTVFLQQGSQIKDSFGGVGPALRETARYALGLVNPFTLAAAAVGAAAFAYKQGSDEITAYQRSLILTGNAAGTTAGRLGDMAKAIDGTVGTQRQAAAALAEVAGSGKFAADQIQAVATAAIAMEEATGKAVSETISEFKRLADEPAAASAKLNEQYNYLTASVYAQIAALEAQGDAVGAQELAIETFGDAMERRANQIEGNLGLIEQAWKGIKNVAAEAWDEMLGVGRESTLQDQLEQLRRARVEAAYGPRGDRAFPSLTDAQSSRFDAEEQRLLLGIQSEGLDAATEGLRAENQKRAIQGLELIGKEAESARSNVDKLRDRLKELNEARDFNIANRSLTPEAQAQFEKSAAALNKQIADAEERAARQPRTARAPAARDDAATRMLLSLRQQSAEYQAQLLSETKLTDAQKKRAEFESLIADLKGKAILTADQKSLLVNHEAIKAQLDQNVALSEEVRIRAQIADEAKKLTAFQQTLADQIANAREAYQLQLATLGLGRQQAERLQESLRLQNQYSRQQSRLQEQFNRGDISQSLYDAETEALQRALEERQALLRESFRAMDDARGEWSNGASAAFADYLTSAQDVAGQTYDLFSNALASTEDAFVQFALTGKASVKDLVDSFAADIARMGARQLTANLAEGLMSFLPGADQSASLTTGAAAVSASAATLSAAGATLVTGAAAIQAAAASLAAASAGSSVTGASGGAGGLLSLFSAGGGYTGAFGFDGGGYTGNAPRSGGIDGKGGFLAILHPQETVTDHTKPSRIQSSGPSGNNVVINADFSGMRTAGEAREATATLARQVNGAMVQAARYS
ncbi:phage tail tape measure protein [Pseudomonas sp. KHPS1]|nr:phage tail tape measure protein [Pseudomonas sp. KHPS1]ATH82298.1 phage tail tape measure protein [Pseudomonas mendocina]UTH38662.1 phage tail tape measure protein [Pseudomonas sp. KHPS1]